jgi:outer membrane PBP1 activator LpoA protein
VWLIGVYLFNTGKVLSSGQANTGNRKMMKQAGHHSQQSMVTGQFTRNLSSRQTQNTSGLRARSITGGLLASLLAFILVGCGSTPPKETTAAPTVSTSTQASTAKQLLAQAAKTQSPEKEKLILQAANLYLKSGDYNRTRNALAEIQQQADLPNDQFVEHVRLLGRVAIHEDSWILAHGILTSERLEQQWPFLEPEIEADLREQRAQVFVRTGDVRASLEERIKLAALITNPQAASQNRETLWRTLMTMPADELQTLASRHHRRDVLAGWYTLAALGKNEQTDLQGQQSALERWQADWPRHPASLDLPGDLKILRQLIDNQPRKIALLLPTSGRLAKAGEAVRDGFFAAYYRNLQEQNLAPEIMQYDSNGDILQVWQQAVDDGAELIIGPLDKEKVAELSLLPSLEVPLLTLNYTDTQEGVTPDNFYQFGLAVEDEARQVARHAHMEGHRYASILIPAQEWTERSARAFSDEWQALGGKVVNYSTFSAGSDYSNTIKDAMLVEQSKERTRNLRRVFGNDLQSQIRRRNDIDMIFLVADPSQARQIKPTLAFHYAGNIPVYSTSQIYSGVEDAKADRDLNGVRFNTLPWLFDNNNPDKKQIDNNAQSSPVYSRLHALGADAFRLYPRLPQLAQVPGMRIYGITVTGKWPCRA